MNRIQYEEMLDALIEMKEQCETEKEDSRIDAETATFLGYLSYGVKRLLDNLGENDEKTTS